MTLDFFWNTANTIAYLCILVDHVHHFLTAVYPSSETEVKSSQTRFINATVRSLYSNDHLGQQISIQWSTFAMWWNRRVTSQMCSRQICSNCVKLPFQHESTPQRIKAVLKLKGVQFSAGKVYLMKWLVSIYAFIAAQAYNHSAAAKQTLTLIRPVQHLSR